MADPILLEQNRDVIDWEQHWKAVLGTRDHGYNRN